MAAGGTLLDSTGKRYLASASGEAQRSNGTTDNCCCGCPCGSDGTGCNANTTPIAWTLTANQEVPLPSCCNMPVLLPNGVFSVSLIYPTGFPLTCCLSSDSSYGAACSGWSNVLLGTGTASTSSVINCVGPVPVGAVFAYYLQKTANLWTLWGLAEDTAEGIYFVVFKGTETVTDPVNCSNNLNFTNSVICGTDYSADPTNPNGGGGLLYGAATDTSTTIVLTACCP